MSGTPSSSWPRSSWSRKRRGEQPTLGEYVERHPELAGEIRDLFPALLMMEDLGEDSSGAGSSLTGDKGATSLDARLQRLGDYRILREVGRGGMGVVYEAEQESLGRRVAVKVLSAGALLDRKWVLRFEREARAAAKLHHTNIVPVFGVGRQDDQHYYVMQFIAGPGLDAVLHDLRRLRQSQSLAQAPEPTAARLVSCGSPDQTAAAVARSLCSGGFGAGEPARADKPALAEASVTELIGAIPTMSPIAAEETARPDHASAVLAESSALGRARNRTAGSIVVSPASVSRSPLALDYANRQGIMHRDIKPSNLLLDAHGHVWVADFGLAKAAELDDLTDSGDIVGTVRYMAPERFCGQCDARSDVYSLGLTLYELVALRPAFEAGDRHKLIERSAARRAGAAREAGAERTAGPGYDHRQGTGARPRGPVRDGRCSGGRLAAVRRGPADSGAAGLAGRAARALVPP